MNDLAKDGLSLDLNLLEMLAGDNNSCLSESLPSAQLCRSHMQFGSERSGLPLTRAQMYSWVHQKTVERFRSNLWSDNGLVSHWVATSWDIVSRKQMGSWLPRCPSAVMWFCCFWVCREAEHPGGGAYGRAKFPTRRQWPTTGKQILREKKKGQSDLVPPSIPHLQVSTTAQQCHQLGPH